MGESFCLLVHLRNDAVLATHSFGSVSPFSLDLHFFAFLGWYRPQVVPCACFAPSWPLRLPETLSLKSNARTNTPHTRPHNNIVIQVHLALSMSWLSTCLLQGFWPHKVFHTHTIHNIIASSFFFSFSFLVYIYIYIYIYIYWKILSFVRSASIYFCLNVVDLVRVRYACSPPWPLYVFQSAKISNSV